MDGLHAIVVTDRDGVPVLKGMEKALQLSQTYFYRPQGKVMFSEAPVSHSVYMGGGTSASEGFASWEGRVLGGGSASRGGSPHLVAGLPPGGIAYWGVCPTPPIDI